jgi:adenylate kinase family enzyme
MCNNRRKLLIENTESCWFIVVTGPPASGKTTLGKNIAKELNIPFYSKDDFKELIFDSMGWDDRNWSKKIGKASIEILYHILEKNLAVEAPIIIETAFYCDLSSKKLSEIIKKYEAKPIQVYCYADETLLRKRFLERVINGERHPGHGDISVAENEYSNLDIYDRYGILDILGTLIKVDTTDFDQIDYSLILNKIKKNLII